VTGIFTFGIALHDYLELTDAVSIGARLLAVSRGAADPCNAAATAVENAAPFLNWSSPSATITFVLNCTAGSPCGNGNGTSVSGTSCPSSTTTLAKGTGAQVTATYPCNLSVFGHNYAPSSCTMTAQTTELIQ
jgi:Flp pilus assembly protein TadG